MGGLIADRYGFQASFATAGATVIIVALVFLPFLLRMDRGRKALKSFIRGS